MKLIKEKFIMYNNAFVNLPEMIQTLDEYKATGYAAAMLLLPCLLCRTNTIGILANTVWMHKKLGIQKRTLLKLIPKLPAFRTDENGLVWSPRLRTTLGLPANPTEEEVAYILKNGNIYFSDPEYDAMMKRISKSKIESFSKHSSKPASQLPDNQEKHIYNKDINISNINRDIKSNKEKAKPVSPCADDYDAKEFKEILSSKSWCRSVKKRMSIDLEDDKILTAFAEWMADYCATMQKKPKNSTDLRQYACNLLRPGSKTRTEFDNTLTDSVQVPEKEERPAVEARSTFEEVVGGIRYSCNGQPLPDNSPGQPTPQSMFSYIRNCWITRTEYDKDSELQKLRTNVRTNPQYITRLGGVAC